MCNSGTWCLGDYYIYDASQPFGTDKICMNCADAWLDEQEDDGEEFDSEDGFFEDDE